MWRGALLLVLADGCDFPSPGTIDNSLNQFDPKTGTLELQARFPNPQHTVLPGQFGRVRVQVEERKEALVIPQRAVQQLQGIQVVYTVGPDSRVLEQAVKTGTRLGEGWLIEQGLKPGDRIIVEGQLKVRPGARVKVLPYQPPGMPGAPATGN
jgi:membrane fusion protein (multidrug efflux system)